MKKCRFYLVFICLVISCCFMIGDVLAEKVTVQYHGCYFYDLTEMNKKGNLNTLSLQGEELPDNYDYLSEYYMQQEFVIGSEQIIPKCGDAKFEGFVLIKRSTQLGNNNELMCLANDDEDVKKISWTSVSPNRINGVKLKHCEIIDSRTTLERLKKEDTRKNEYYFVAIRDGNFNTTNINDVFSLSSIRQLKSDSNVTQDQKIILDNFVTFLNIATKDKDVKITDDDVACVKRGEKCPTSDIGNNKLDKDPLNGGSDNTVEKKTEKKAGTDEFIDNASTSEKHCEVSFDKENCEASNCIYHDDSYGKFCSPSGLVYLRCGSAKDIPVSVPELSSFAVTFLKIATPIVLILISVFQMVKAITSNKEDDMKKAQASLIKRIIAGALVFFVVTIFQFVMLKLADNDNEKADIKSCLSCLLNGPDDCDNIYFKDGYGGNYSIKNGKIEKLSW